MSTCRDFLSVKQIIPVHCPKHLSIYICFSTLPAFLPNFIHLSFFIHIQIAAQRCTQKPFLSFFVPLKLSAAIYHHCLLLISMLTKWKTGQTAEAHRFSFVSIGCLGCFLCVFYVFNWLFGNLTAAWRWKDACKKK